jgi:hypothetical protein
VRVNHLREILSTRNGSRVLSGPLFRYLWAVNMNRLRGSNTDSERAMRYYEELQEAKGCGGAYKPEDSE